ncbi:unnamed protein product [Staurois parvus]|uniref:Uncharacterized protein n=1 Tax=Staurois parvus TaxID=386267 RepID=A0ABN9HRE8_9NEOB|nr:unnamed protein product [Staurois parvus]
MIGKGPDQKRRLGPFREYRTCVLCAVLGARSQHICSFLIECKSTAALRLSPDVGRPHICVQPA